MKDPNFYYHVFLLSCKILGIPHDILCNILLTHLFWGLTVATTKADLQFFEDVQVFFLSTTWMILSHKAKAHRAVVF